MKRQEENLRFHRTKKIPPRCKGRFIRLSGTSTSVGYGPGSDNSGISTSVGNGEQLFWHLNVMRVLSAFPRLCSSSLSRQFSCNTVGSGAPNPASPLLCVRLRYVFKCATPTELVSLRAPLRAAHLAHVSAAAPPLVMGGAVSCSPPESLLVFKTTDVDAVAAFARADPYVTGGIVASWEVASYTVVAGSVS